MMGLQMEKEKDDKSTIACCVMVVRYVYLLSVDELRTPIRFGNFHLP